MVDTTCPFTRPGAPTSGYFKHRRRGEKACRACMDLFVAHGNKSRDRHLLRCEFCGRAFNSRRGQKFCSRPCASRSIAASREDRRRRLPVVHPSPDPTTWLPAKHPARRPAAVRRRWWSVIVQGACAHCGGQFTATSGSTSPVHLPRFCSDQCQRRHSRGKRRARKRDAFVEPVFRRRVFERDGWRCQICGERVDRRCKVPHPRSAVLDHIVPLASGGTHEMSNVQCAHFLCNSRKGDRAAADQLLLFG